MCPGVLIFTRLDGIKAKGLAPAGAQVSEDEGGRVEWRGLRAPCGENVWPLPSRWGVTRDHLDVLRQVPRESPWSA